MAEDLDDGELWLPSDIVPDLGLRRYPKPPPSDLAVLDAVLARRLAALRLLAPTRLPKPKPPNPLLAFHPRLSRAQLETLHGVHNNGVAAAQASRPVGSGMVYGLNQMKAAPQPPPFQVDGDFALRMARVAPRHQASGPARFLPVRSAGSRARGGGGTGVFLPRVVNNEAKKKHCNKNVKGEQQKQGARNVASVKQQSMTFQSPSPEVGLPHDWTY